jgi:O-methyltransferase involved in polyketide biosynthesis
MDNDQLSQTAAFVAIKFYGLTRSDLFQSLFDKSIINFYDRLVQSLPAPLCYYHYWLKFGWVRRLYIWSEELLLPGDLLHVVARKWYLKRLIDQLVDQGYKQMIVLGGGFDHTATVYTAQGLRCVELDTPYMTRLKKQFLTERYPNAPHPEFISSLLPGNRLDTQFSDHPAVDPDQKTVVVAEGFFDYLNPQTVSDSLRQIQAFFSHRPTLIGTHFALDELSGFHRWIFTNSVKMVGEQLEFNTSADTFEQMILDNNFRSCQLFGTHTINKKIRSQIETSLPLLQGFYMFRAT